MEREEAVRCLVAIQAAYAGAGRIVREDGAIRIPDHRYPSVGAHKLNSFYYKLQPNEVKLVDAAEDKVAERRRLSTKHVLERDAQMLAVRDLVPLREFSEYDAPMMVDDELAKAGLEILPGNYNSSEFLVGLPTHLVRMSPERKEALGFPVGAIDRIRYCAARKRLVLLELKTNQWPQQWKSSLEKMFLKERNVRQICWYAWLLLRMAEQANIPLRARHIELCLVGVALKQNRMAAWRIEYDPDRFLKGMAWSGATRWHPLLGPGQVVLLPELQQQQQLARAATRRNAGKRAPQCGQCEARATHKRRGVFYCTQHMMATRQTQPTAAPKPPKKCINCDEYSQTEVRGRALCHNCVEILRLAIDV